MNKFDLRRITDVLYDYDLRPVDGRVWSQELHIESSDLAFEFASITGVWKQSEVRAHMAVREVLLRMISAYGLTDAKVKW